MRTHESIPYRCRSLQFTVEGMEDVSVKLASEDMFELKDVKFIPDLKKNLISSSQHDKSSYKVVFEGGS